ncbi:MAG: rod shape-determining protein MreC [Odoribacter splanchnicus]|nr:rod shape-determining protein MreC [Odoribacter splanchnicus]
MKEIIKLILKYHFTIIFILLEAVSFSLIVQHNNYQRTVFSGHTATFFCYISSTISDIDNYFSLKETNEKLVAENTDLRNRIENIKSALDGQENYIWGEDSSFFDTDYRYQSARMVNSSFNKTKNYITLDKGSSDGVAKEMAVCSREGVVGIIQNTSRHYARVLPLVNTNLRVSAKLKKNGYYGSLQWDGNDYRYSYLNDIPFHVDVAQGDTIVTSGFSSIFPEGELIGFVETVNKETANFLTIKVKLAVDFKKISDVYVVANLNKSEKLELEEMTHD